MQARDSERAQRFIESQTLGLHGVTHDGVRYRCHECGDEWAPGERRSWWPVSLRWSTVRFGFSAHGSVVGYDGIEQKIVATHVRIGWIVISFGWVEDELPSVDESRAALAKEKK